MQRKERYEELYENCQSQFAKFLRKSRDYQTDKQKSNYKHIECSTLVTSSSAEMSVI